MMSEKSAEQPFKNSSSNIQDYSEELRILMRDRFAQQEMNNKRERELNLLRSGSAPPTVDRSFGGSHLGRVDSSDEELMRSDPAYLSYYYQNVNMNPRLPQPLQAKEDWVRNMQTLGQSGDSSGLVIGDRRRIDRAVGGGEETMFNMQSGFVGPNAGRKVHWGDEGLTRLPHMVQDEKVNAPSLSAAASELRASISRTATHDPQLLARVSSPEIPALGISRLNTFDRRNASVPNFYEDDVLDMPESVVASLSGLSLSMDNVVDEGIQNPGQRFSYPNKNLKGPQSSTSYSGANSPGQYFNMDSLDFPLSPSMLQNHAVGNLSPFVGNRGIQTRPFSGGMSLGSNSMSSAAELRNYARLANHGPGNGSQVAPMDPSCLEYLMSNGYSAAALNDLMINGVSSPNGQRDLLALQKAYYEALLQKAHYGLSNVALGNSGFGAGFPYNGNSMSPTMLPDSPVRYPSGLRNGNFGGPWPSEQTFSMGGGLTSLLDEFKGNKTRCFELAEIQGHVVEFSMDQFGSRFIQQKLETACAVEKNMVYDEIMPHALPLMTDVFGNYVVQKFLEHGSSSQIRKLAEKLIGHVLTLSLQMYGCRVIQKAIEVVELDQQTRMVAELDGHVMRCVRDQNGNHVIQKCIECIPEIAIQFIITTFYEHVVALSTHPYGCRVIQRVLEHCRTPATQSIVMKEIMQSVCMLAQDQYGNYVIQHVMEHGKPYERSAIISQLVGKVVEMSQQKFASNVIEKCLSFGNPEERQIVVDEILGSPGDESEPLQILMKDQFANYVVQKVLETCDDQQLELILNRIKVHLNALKKYTYGKHIVARVEKLVAAGERRISFLSYHHPGAQM